MSHPSISTSEAEPPIEEPAIAPEEDEPTVDLEEPALAEETLPGGEWDFVVSDLEEQDEETGPVSADDLTLDLPNEDALLIGSDLQKGKYRVLGRRAGALDGLPLPGATYTALHVDLQKRLTLRYLPLDRHASAEEHEQTTARFLREVRMLARLDHPSLPRVHDYFCEGAACYVVMDEVSERTLTDVLAEAAQQGRTPALPPLRIAQLALELVRALGYLHQQRPPLALGRLRAEDVALPTDGPAQLMSLGALSMVASVSSASLPTLPLFAESKRVDASAPSEAEDEETLPEAAPARPPEPGDDLYGLGVLLRELAGGAAVVARVMERLHHPDAALQAAGADNAPPISLALAGVIQVAAHDEPARRFQSAAAFETALMRAWVVERRIARQVEQARRDIHATRMENGEEDVAATSLDNEPPGALLHGEMATRNFTLDDATSQEEQTRVCWRCGGHNAGGALLCRVCGAHLSVFPDTLSRAEVGEDAPRPSAPLAARDGGGRRRQARTTRRLPPRQSDESGWAEWAAGDTVDVPTRPRRSRPTGARGVSERDWIATPPRRYSAPLQRQRDEGRRLLWGLVWLCFVMAFVLGSATVVVTYLALR